MVDLTKYTVTELEGLWYWLMQDYDTWNDVWYLDEASRVSDEIEARHAAQP